MIYLQWRSFERCPPFWSEAFQIPKKIPFTNQKNQIDNFDK